MSMARAAPQTKDIAFVLQGNVGSEDAESLKRTIATLRRLAPDSQIIVSTWEACAQAVATVNADLVFSADPGALHSIRVSGESKNNINRQIVSTRAGLERCERRYAVKMRVDTEMRNLSFLHLYANYQPSDGPERIVVPMLFTLDPEMFEQVPMHVSDWFQFGTAKALRRYWDCPFMSPEEAVWYGTHRYAPHSTHLDKRFYCLFAVEQHLARHYAKGLGYPVPQFHNDVRPEIIDAHRKLLAKNFIVADLDQIGLYFPKYDWASRSNFQRLNCIDFYDWLDLLEVEGQVMLSLEQRSRILKRKQRKRSARRLYYWARPLWPVLSSPMIKMGVNLLLRRIVASGA